MNCDRDKLLTEAMGLCYPDYVEDSIWDGVERNYFARCKICGREQYAHDLVYPPINFSTPDGFFKLWNWSKTQDIWYNISELLGQCDAHCIIQPDEFANTVYEMLKEKENA